MLFLREPEAHLRTWEGDKLSKEEAQRISGIKSVRWLREFPATFHRLMCEAEHVYLNSNEHPSAALEVASRDARFIQQTLSKYPLFTGTIASHEFCTICEQLIPARNRAPSPGW